MRTTFVLLLAGVIGVPALTAAGDKPGRPKLDMKVTPRFAFSPVTVAVTATLVGGGNAEDFNCPELEWEWDDGSKSAHESDCEPLGAGGEIQRRYTASHEFRRAGTYNVKLTMRKNDKPLAQQTVKVMVRAGLGDASPDSE